MNFGGGKYWPKGAGPSLWSMKLRVRFVKKLLPLAIPLSIHIY